MNRGMLESELLQNADVVCLQEIRCNNDDAERILAQAFPQHYRWYSCCSTGQKGYSGVALLLHMRMRIRPHVKVDVTRHVWPGKGGKRIKPEPEGRILTAVLPGAAFVCVYAPNSGLDGLKRLDYRIRSWEPAFRIHVVAVRAHTQRPVIVMGDLNVAATPDDVHHPDRHNGSACFTAEERVAFTRLLRTTGLRDAYRQLHRGDGPSAYTYWSNFARSRERGLGWRIDYCLVPDGVRVLSAKVEQGQMGSDHAPLTVALALERGTGGWLGRGGGGCDTRAVLRAHQIFEVDKQSRYGAAAYSRVLEQVEPGTCLGSEDALGGLEGVGPKIREAILGSPPSTARLDEARSVDMLMRVPWIGVASALDLVRGRERIVGGPAQLLEMGEDALGRLLTPQQRTGLRYLEDIDQPIPRAEAPAHRRAVTRALERAGLRATVHIAGSYRRGLPTLADVDLVLVPDERCCETLNMQGIVAVLRGTGYLEAELALGDQKCLGIARIGPSGTARRLDMQLATSRSFPFAMLYLTGPRGYTLAMRMQARKLGMSLSEHGLAGAPAGTGLASEREIHAAIGIPYVPPRRRT